MPLQLQKGRVFNPGDTVEAADLNNLVDNGSALVGLISEQGAVDAVGTDQVLINRGGVLHRANASTFPQGVTSVSVVIDSAPSVLNFSVATPATTPVFHIGLDNQTGNKVLAAPADGTSGTPTFRALVPADMPVGTLNVPAGLVDCTLGNVFEKTLPTGAGPFNIVIQDLANGQTIRLRIINNAAGTNNVVWAAMPSMFILWRGGTLPVVTHSPNARDIFTFTRIVQQVYGYADQDFQP